MTQNSCRSALVVFNRLLDEVRWNEGRCCYSLQWFANSCGLNRNTVTLAFKALKRAGHVLLAALDPWLRSFLVSPPCRPSRFHQVDALDRSSTASNVAMQGVS